MIDHLLRDLQVLRKADILIGKKIWLNVLARRLGLFAFAGLCSLLGMANVAGYKALRSSIGLVWAATVAANADFAIASIMLLFASRSRPSPEIDIALELRKQPLSPFTRMRAI